MKAPSADRRTEKTRKKLKEALIRLLQTRHLQSISIKEIAEQADISRGTFYLHYRDIFDLYDAIEKDVVENIAEIVRRPSPVRDEDGLERMIDAIFEYLAKHIDACEALLKTDSASFLSRAFEANRPSTKESWDTLFGMDDEARTYSYVFISYGFAGMLRLWMETGRQEPPAHIAQIVKRLLNSFILSGREGQS